MTLPNIELPNLTDTGKILNMLRDAMIAQNTGLQNVRDDVNEIKADVTILNQVIVTGASGELPLKEQVRNHDGYIKDLKYWARFIGGALIIQTIAFSFGVIIAIVRFLPLMEALSKQP